MGLTLERRSADAVVSTSDTIPAGDTLSSIAKAMLVLRSLAEADDGEVGVSQVAACSGLAKSTAHRVLTELVQVGFVSKCGSRYRLGKEWFTLQSALASSECGQLIDAARRPLAWLFETTGATVHLGVLRDDQVLYLEKLTARGGTQVPTRVGAQLPAACTALGKAMLAFGNAETVRSVLSNALPILARRSIAVPALLVAQLRDVARTGLAFEVGESHALVSCVAAPVLVDGRAVAAVSVSRLSSCLPPHSDGIHVRRAANEIASYLRSAA